MTPEKLVEKYKERISQYLDDDDKEVLSAYIQMEIDKREAKLVRWAKTWDAMGIIAMITVAIAVIIFFGWFLTSCLDAEQMKSDHALEIDRLKTEYQIETRNLYNRHEVELQSCKAETQICNKQIEDIKEACIEGLLGKKMSKNTDVQ